MHMYNLKSEFIEERKVYINDIPAILLRPKNTGDKLATIIFYHGWTSNKEAQKMRGLILAIFGYQVLIPDGPYHGERNPIQYSRANHKYFWEIIFKNMEEVDYLIDELVDKHGGDKDNIIAMGHSMGGFTAGGIFTHNNRVKSAIVVNGSLAWEYANKLLVKRMDLEISEELKQIEKKIIQLDPINHLEKLIDRPLLLLNGDGDLVVSPKSQKLFMDKAQSLYSDKNKIRHIEYSYVGHFVTTNMMEDSISWIKNL